MDSLKGRRCLVTGASGFIGQVLVRKLLAAGAIVHAPGRTELDLDVESSIRRTVRDFAPEKVFHLAAKGVAGVGSLETLRETNVRGTRRLVAELNLLPHSPTVTLLGSGFEYAAKETPLKEVDALSPFSDYGISKIEAAAAAREAASRLSVAWVRLFNVYGPGEPPGRLLPHIVSQSRKGLPTEVTAGEQLRDFTHVDDVAEGIMRLAAQPAVGPGWETFNLGTGTSTRLHAFMSLVVAALANHGVVSDLRLGARPYRPGEPMVYLPDISRLQKAVGWLPATPLDIGVSDAVSRAILS
jgi:UDP-glucose 4-epimerase